MYFTPVRFFLKRKSLKCLLDQSVVALIKWRRRGLQGGDQSARENVVDITKYCFTELFSSQRAGPGQAAAVVLLLAQFLWILLNFSSSLVGEQSWENLFSPPPDLIHIRGSVN